MQHQKCNSYAETNEALFAQHLTIHFSKLDSRLGEEAHIRLISSHPQTFVYYVLTQFYRCDHISSFHFLPKHYTLAYICAFVYVWNYVFGESKNFSTPEFEKFDRPYVCINILHNMNMKCIYVPIYISRQRHRTIFTSIGLTLKWPWICGGNDPVKNATKNRVYKSF